MQASAPPAKGDTTIAMYEPPLLVIGDRRDYALYLDSAQARLEG